MLKTMPAKLLVISGVLAFLFLHTPFPLVLALGFYCIIWLAERLYHLIIALAKVACFAYIAFLLFQSLSLYIPPEIPMVGRKDQLWLNHSQLFAVTSILAGS